MSPYRKLHHISKYTLFFLKPHFLPIWSYASFQTVTSSFLLQNSCQHSSSKTCEPSLCIFSTCCSRYATGPLNAHRNVLITHGYNRLVFLSFLCKNNTIPPTQTACLTSPCLSRRYRKIIYQSTFIHYNKLRDLPCTNNCQSFYYRKQIL